MGSISKWNFHLKGENAVYTIDIGNIVVVPVDFNIFYESAQKYRKNIRYSKDCTISESFFDELFFLISKKTDKYFALDMKNVVSYPTRLFTRLEKYLDRIVFYNIMVESRVKDRISEDLEQLIWKNDTMAYFSNNSNIDIEDIVNNQGGKARRQKTNEIIKDLVCCDNKKLIHLESSGLYSNCYVDIKRLFLNVDNYYYIIFSLAERVFSSISQVDALVSSSKNGAIIANILGGLLDVKEVHLIGVGPKYSMELGDTIDCIKQGKKYAYIFDFMCTGTELKIVSALINSKKAYLTYAAGIAKYNNDVRTTAIDKIEVLTDTKEMEINYKLMGEMDNR